MSLTKKFILIFILSFPNISSGQVPNDSLLSAFYNETIKDFFLKSSERNRKKQDKFKWKLIQTNIDSTNLIKSHGKDKFKYYNKRNVHKVLSRPYKRNIGRDIYKIRYKSFGEDTIDILIVTWTIEKISKKNISFHGGCGGDMGYIPEGRFVFNKVTKSWIFYSYEDIVEQKLKEEERIEELIRSLRLKKQKEE